MTLPGASGGENSICTEHTIVYPNIPSALRLVKHNVSLRILKSPQQWTLHEEESTSTPPEDAPGTSCTIVDPDFLERTVPHLMSQAELNDLVRDLNLSKIQKKLLGSRLQGWKFLQQGVTNVIQEMPAVFVIILL